jgi:hypothetical protein
MHCKLTKLYFEQQYSLCFSLPSQRPPRLNFYHRGHKEDAEFTESERYSPLEADNFYNATLFLKAIA